MEFLKFLLDDTRSRYDTNPVLYYIKKKINSYQ